MSFLGRRFDDREGKEREVREGETGSELELTLGSSDHLLDACHAPIQRSVLLQDSKVDVVLCSSENESVRRFGGRIWEPGDGDASRQEGGRGLRSKNTPLSEF